jgi:hypothetical protein
MRNIFILYMPPRNGEAMIHYEETIRKKVPLARIAPHVDPGLRRRLDVIFQGKPVAVWGSQSGPQNTGKFDKMKEGDEVLIVEGENIKLLGRVAGKLASPALSKELWRALREGDSTTWDLIYFIANPREINVPFIFLKRLLGYSEQFQLRGFMNVAATNLESFYLRYDDLYSVLMQYAQTGQIREAIDPQILQASRAEAFAELPAPVADEPDEDTPDHLRMQYLLLKMGRGAGEKVWAPRGDQSRLTDRFQFTDFEDTFAAGLDAQVKYVENIDVVWKDEFRIDAAFEVENSTSIYSGLLRFADLAMVAPNTLYPMFIVAPSERRNRVREQLSRPVFKHLRLAEKVRYLPCEQVDEIDRFFKDGQRGLSVEVFVGKAEKFSN